MGELVFVDQYHPADPELVAFDGVSIRDRIAIDLRSVGGSQVFDAQLIIALRDDAVMPRNALVGDLNIAVAAAPQLLRFVRKFENPVEVIRYDAQKSHSIDHLFGTVTSPLGDMNTVPVTVFQPEI